MPHQLSVLMVSDFFYPNIGGVENHIYQLSHCLITRGHKVVVLTHAYGDRKGVRYLSNGLKVYYVPRLPLVAGVILPTVLGGWRLLRSILLRERITLLHAHQAFSPLAHEAILHARTMGYKVVFTDHSLFGFADASSILTNKCLKFTLADVHQVICVSHTSKENTVLRACVPAQRVHVVPNAVDATQFQPAAPADDQRAQDHGRVVVIVLCRLVYRKGVDLLVAVIPEVCRRHPHVDFMIGGDGPRAGQLRAMVDRHQLAGRVRMLGVVPHERVRDVFAQGHVFLNASLTEAFCMALVEAAAAGLVTVSTAVGGLPEVLPPHLALLAAPQPAALVAALGAALLRLPVDRWRQHLQVSEMYSWSRIAQRTERVYDAALSIQRDDSLLGRLRRYYLCGTWFGKLCCCIVAVDVLCWRWLEWCHPRKDIDSAPDFPGQVLQRQHH